LVQTQKIFFLGLGNPGSKYDLQRHNVGKDYILSLGKDLKAPISPNKSILASAFESHNGLFQWYASESYVNESGKTALKILKKNKIKPEQLIVIYDDLDLETGKLKFKFGGGHGGHNGIRDIIHLIGSNFYRLRIGISHPGSKDDVTKWVLSKFKPTEKNSIKKAYKTINNMVKQGLSVILISHKLHEVLSISDRIIVLRNGKIAGEQLTKSADYKSIASLIVGKEIQYPKKTKSLPTNEILKLEEFGNALFIDGELQVSEKDEKKYSGQFVSSALNLSKDNSSAAIIGGGDGGVARELSSKGFDLIDWYELDPEVVKVCQKHLPKVCGDAKANNKVKTYWGDAFESIKKVKDSKYDKVFVDLNDDDFCINLAAKNMKGLKRILKPGGTITAQVGCLSKNPKQVKNWLGVLESNFGNVELSEVFIPSFDCRWSFASSYLK